MTAGHDFEAKPNSRLKYSSGTADARVTRCPTCYRNGIRYRDWDAIIARATEVKNQFGYLPPATWFQSNGDSDWSVVSTQ